MTHINEARGILDNVEERAHDHPTGTEFVCRECAIAAIAEALTASQEQQAEIEVLRAALTVASGALSEASDKFHVLSFYIKDTPARECCEAKVGEMFSANKIARQALSPERGGE